MNKEIKSLNKLYAYLINNVSGENTVILTSFIDGFLLPKIKEVAIEVAIEGSQLSIEKGDSTGHTMIAHNFPIQSGTVESGTEESYTQEKPAREDFTDIKVCDIEDVVWDNPMATKFVPSGNGHDKAKKRKLDNSERNIIRTEFIKLNGEIKEDFCLPILDKMGEEITIFQVTGFVSLLHRYVAEGRLVLNDMHSYEKTIRSHRSMWARFKKFQKIT